MTARDLIKKYSISYNDESTIKVGCKPNATDLQLIKDAKPEILAILKADKKAKDNACLARQNAIAAIEGLEGIRKALAAEHAYHKAFTRMMEDEFNDGVNPPARPSLSSDDLKKQYPRAAAYVKAENWTYASNYAKSAAGEKALERIINDEDYTIALTDMDAEWSEAAHKAAMYD